MVYSKYMKDGGKIEMRKAIAVILSIVLSLCIFAGCGPQKTGENVMPEEDFNFYEDGKLVAKPEDLGINVGYTVENIGNETYRKLKIGDSIDLMEALYGNEIVCYEDESGKLQECSVSEFIEKNKDEEYIRIYLYRIYYDDKIYSKKEISQLPEDDSKFFTYKNLALHSDGEKVINIDISYGRKPLGFKLA